MEKKQYIDIELVKALMKEKGIGEKAMAKLMRVTPPTLKRFLNGADQRHYSSAVIVKLSFALNVSPNMFMSKDYR